MNIVEILKVGLPGLVFLLCYMSYRLLSKEQGKNEPNPSMLKSIKAYMLINILLAILTLSAPIIDSRYVTKQKKTFFNVEAKVTGTPLSSGTAAVCCNAEYSGRYILINDKLTSKMVQVYAKGILPCDNSEFIALDMEDAIKLGWSNNNQSSKVELAAAEDGQMYILNTSI